MYQYDVLFNLHLMCTVAPRGAEFYKQALLPSLTSSIQTALERKLHLHYKGFGAQRVKYWKLPQIYTFHLNIGMIKLKALLLFLFHSIST